MDDYYNNRLGGADFFLPQLSFIGLRALHILSLTSLPVVFMLYIVLVGVTGDKLHLAVSETATAATAVTASGVLGYAASQIGFTVSYSAIASDFVSTGTNGRGTAVKTKSDPGAMLQARRSSSRSVRVMCKLEEDAPQLS